MNNSPIDRLLSLPEFKPFSGKKAFKILQNATKKLKITSSEKDKILKAVSSLGIITNEDTKMFLEIQENLCTGCGECCTNRTINIKKQELKQISDNVHINYKKLKRKLRALPKGNNTFDIICNPCFFYKENKCIIHQLKPEDCKVFPTNNIIRAISEQKYELLPSCNIVEDLLTKLVISRVKEEEEYERMK
jgi:Fe-S-cluster containining protein